MRTRSLLLVPVFLLFFISFGHSIITLSNHNMTIMLSENGSAHVIETYVLVLNGEYDLSLYQQASAFNTIAAWQNFTNLSAFRPYVNIKQVCISNLQIRPQPVRPSLLLDDVWYGTVFLTYDANPCNTSKNSTGLVFIKHPKPRTISFKFNPNALSFQRTESGDIILPDNTELILVLPRGSIITDINPLPQGMQHLHTPIQMQRVVWSGITLSHFTLTFYVEHPISEEVVSFFNHMQKEMYSYLETENGKLVALVVCFLGFALYYLHTQYSRMKKRGKHDIQIRKSHHRVHKKEN